MRAIMKSRSPVAAVFFLAAIAAGSTSVQAQAAGEPWKEPNDTLTALLQPDRYAWQLFVALNWPGNPEKKEADPAKVFGAAGSVTWETWRNSRPEAPNTVFRRDGADPGPWLTGSGPVVAREESQFRGLPLKQQMFLAMRSRGAPGGPAPAFDEAVGGGNEVRLNKSTYEFIRENKLYNVEGQIARFTAGALNLSFPVAAKEIKAQWRIIKEAAKPRYHWAEVTKSNGTKEIWGLTGLHITTKDLPNWFWATFEHIDNKQAGEVAGGPANTGWLTQSVDRFACPAPPHDCEQAPAGIGLQGTKWENYRLRGTQVDFVDSIGTPTILANSQIESPFQRQSSCITCHAQSTIDKDGNDIGFAPNFGAPRPDWFKDPTGRRIFMQRDFVWSFMQASRANP